MVEQIYTSFLSLAYLKHSLKLNTVSTFDEKLTGIVDRANDELDNVVNPFISTPVGTGHTIFSHCRAAALNFAKSIWADEELNDMDKLKTYTDIYDTKILKIQKELRADKNTRTKTILVAKSIKKLPISPKAIRGLSLNY